MTAPVALTNPDLFEEMEVAQSSPIPSFSLRNHAAAGYRSVVAATRIAPVTGAPGCSC